MTVKQLIEKLQQFDPEIRVFVSGYEGGYDDLVTVSEIKDIALDVHDAWYYGDHEDADHSRVIDSNAFQSPLFNEGY